MERLRYMARAPAVPVTPLVHESAAALSAFADDPMDLLVSCRRLLDRRGECGPLVWLAARMLTALDPRQEARDAMDDFDRDPTGWELQDNLSAGASVLALGDRGSVTVALHTRPDLTGLDPDDPEAVADADLVVVSSDCAGPSEALVAADAVAVAEAARELGTPVWLLAGVGRVLPERMWSLLCSRCEPGVRGLAVLDLDSYVTRVLTPAGLVSPAEAARQSDCPVVPELFSR